MGTENYQASNVVGEKSLDLSSRIELTKYRLYREPAAEDRISRLPEDILIFILSFLTLKEAVQTSVLSSRWMTLWAHTSRLDFEATSNLGLFSRNSELINGERSKYVAWVKRVLHLHKGATLDEFNTYTIHSNTPFKVYPGPKRRRSNNVWYLPSNLLPRVRLLTHRFLIFSFFLPKKRITQVSRQPSIDTLTIIDSLLLRLPPKSDAADGYPPSLNRNACASAPPSTLDDYKALLFWGP